MEPLRELGKMFLIVGVVLAVAGVLLMSGARLPLRLGRLPGDIAYRAKGVTFYFPIATCIVLSLAFTLVLWIVNHLRR
jgi:Protein of unknown function (DUF2905)